MFGERLFTKCLLLKLLPCTQENTERCHLETKLFSQSSQLWLLTFGLAVDNQ